MKLSTITVIISLVVITACGKGGNPTTDVQAPDAAALLSPADNEACLNGVTIDSSSATVTLSWRAAANADSYDLVVKNLLSAVQTTYPVSGISKDLVLSKAQPYSWHVVSKSSHTALTAQSAIWKFYVAGNPTTDYAPFPATIIAPAANEVIPSTGGDSVKVAFHWTATDVDNDIAYYTIYLDNSNASTKVVPSITVDTTSLTLATMKTYFWRVVTTDRAGNTSDSGIYIFSL
jgi:hypothetical protein